MTDAAQTTASERPKREAAKKVWHPSGSTSRSCLQGLSLIPAPWEGPHARKPQIFHPGGTFLCDRTDCDCFGRENLVMFIPVDMFILSLERRRWGGKGALSCSLPSPAR